MTIGEKLKEFENQMNTIKVNPFDSHDLEIMVAIDKNLDILLVLLKQLKKGE